MYIYSVEINNKVEDIISLLSPEQAHETGLPSQSILGKLLNSVDRGGDITDDNFVVNPVFVKLLHEVIAEYAPQLKVTQHQAQQQVNGWLYMIDFRRPNSERLDPLENMLEDIIGAFEVCDSKILPGSYQPMETHKIISHRGLFKIEQELYEHLIKKISAV
jgi:hypothetical protein